LVSIEESPEDTQGRHFTIEMQVKPDDFYIERVVFYGAKLHTDQLPSGTVYRQLEKTMSISILDHRLYFIKQSERYSDPGAEVPEVLLEEEAIAMALESFRRMSASEEVHMLVEEREKAKRDWNHMMYEAHLSGIEKGMAEGITVGKEEGIAIGEEKARVEKVEAERRFREMARAMKAEGIEVEVIMRVTRLSGEELREIYTQEHNPLMAKIRGQVNCSIPPTPTGGRHGGQVN